MVKRLVIIGASGHGKVIADIAVRNGYEEIVFLDDNESIKECAGFKVVGKTSDASRLVVIRLLQSEMLRFVKG